MTLACVLRTVIEQKLVIERGPRSDVFQAYLDDGLTYLNKNQPYAIDQSTMLAEVYAADAVISSQDRINLLSALKGIRPTLYKRTERVLSTGDDASGNTVILLEQGATYVDKRIDRSVHARDISKSVIGDRNQFRDSFNDIIKSSNNEDLRGQLDELRKSLEALLANLPENVPEKDAASLAKDVTDFAKEAVAEAPRSYLLQAVGDNIKKVAGSVAKYGPPVVAAVASVLKIVGALAL